MIKICPWTFNISPWTAYQLQEEKTNYTVRKSNNTWSRWITINTTNKRQMVICGSRSDARRRTQLNYSIFQQRMQILSLIMRSESHSVMSDSEMPWTIQSVEFSRPEYWSGQPFLSPGDLPNPGIKPRSPALQADSLPAEPPGKPLIMRKYQPNTQ